MDRKTKMILLCIIIAITFIPDLVTLIEIIADYYLPNFIYNIVSYLYMFRWIIRIVCIILIIVINSDRKEKIKKNKTLVPFILSFIPAIILFIYSFVISFKENCIFTTCYTGIDALFFNLFIYGFLISPILSVCLIYQIVKIVELAKSQNKKMEDNKNE